MATIIGSTGGETLTGTAADDTILALGGSDTIVAAAGSDLIVAGAGGSDSIDGGAGSDTLILAGANASYSVAFTGGNIILTIGGTVETVTGVERVVFDDTVLRIVGAGSEHATIQSAVDAATSGETILVAPGTYTETVTISTANLKITGANSAVVAHAAGDYNAARGTESALTGKFVLNADGLTISGFEITGADAAIQVNTGGQSLDNITLSNIYIHDTTDSSIRAGLGFGGGIGSEDWSITGNLIDGINGNARTGMVLFNIDGLTVTDNVINHDDAGYTGRRGVNLDGVLNANVTGNTVNMGLVAPTDATVANAASPWAIQISMSDRAVENVNVSGNTVSGTNSGIIGLSQRSMVNVDITGNTVTDVVSGIVLNTGGVAPVAPGVTMDVEVTGNTVSAAINAIFVRDLHDAATNGPVTFAGLDVTGNTVNSGVVQIGRLESSQPAADGLLNITDPTTIDGSANADTVRVEGTGAVTFNAGEGNDTFIGGSGNDIIDGAGGNDVINGGAGSDALEERAMICWTVARVLTHSRAAPAMTHISRTRPTPSSRWTGMAPIPSS